MGDKIIRLWPDFSNVAKHCFIMTSIDEKVFFLQVSIVFRCFQSEKSNNKFDFMQSFLLKHFTKVVKINFRGSKAKTSHISYFPFSICLNLYKSTILHLVKTFRLKTYKESIRNCHKKACNHARIISSNFKPEVDALLNTILGLANAPIVETKFLELAMSLLDFSPRLPLGTFSILLVEFESIIIFRIKIDWNCNFVGLLHYPFWLKLDLALSGTTLNF